MQIELYKSWMKDEVVRMFEVQYDVPFEEFSQTFDHFYEHEFQKANCIRVVALEDESVIGFQSFFYWPYTFQGKIYRAFQSGNSLVHPEHRGKGVFGNLLKFIDNEKEMFGIDFLVGFPVEASYNSFIRKGWSNPFNLIWAVKAISISSVFSSAKTEKIASVFNQVLPEFENDDDYLTIENSELFIDYRKAFRKGEYFTHLYIEDGEQVFFQMKLNIRKKVIRELIIGHVKMTKLSIELLTTALKDLTKRVKLSKSIGMLSIAYPESSKIFKAALSENKFKSIDKRVYFICKDYPQEIEKAISESKALVFRADIDTW